MGAGDEFLASRYGSEKTGRGTGDAFLARKYGSSKAKRATTIPATKSLHPAWLDEVEPAAPSLHNQLIAELRAGAYERQRKGTAQPSLADLQKQKQGAMMLTEPSTYEGVLAGVLGLPGVAGVGIGEAVAAKAASRLKNPVLRAVTPAIARSEVGVAEALGANALLTAPTLIEDPAAWWQAQKQGAKSNILLGAVMPQVGPALRQTAVAKALKKLKSARQLPTAPKPGSVPPLAGMGNIGDLIPPEPIVPSPKPIKPRAELPSPAKTTGTPLVTGDRVSTVVEGKTITGRVVHPKSQAKPYVLLDKAVDGGRRWDLEGNDWAKVEKGASATSKQPVRSQRQVMRQLKKGEFVPETVEAWRTVIPGFEDMDWFAHRALGTTPGKTATNWTVSEASTGGMLATGKTRAEAIEIATRKLARLAKQHGHDYVRQVIADSPKIGIAPTQTPVEPSVAPDAVPKAQPQAKEPWEMTPQELDTAIAIERGTGTSAESRVFGPAGAKRYNAAQRTLNSSTVSPHSAAYKQAAATVSAMEKGLTPEQERILFGIGETGPNLEELTAYRSAISSIDYSSPEAMGESLRFDLPKLEPGMDPTTMTLDQRLSYARMRHALVVAQHLGWDTKAISDAAMQSAAQRFGTPDKAREMLEQWLPKKTGSAPQQATSPPLPSPEPTVSTVEAARQKYGLSVKDMQDPANQAILIKEGGVKPEALTAWQKAQAGTVKLYSGLDPREVIRRADDLDITPPPGRGAGTFTVERQRLPSRDFDLRDRFLQPLGIYDPEGSIIQKGSYDRLGEVQMPDGSVKSLGTPVGQAIRRAERNITGGTFEANKTIDHIGELVRSTVKPTLNPIARKRMTDKAFGDFIDLVEKPLDDPSRVALKASSSPVGQALKLHDDMTDGFRNYIVESRRNLGIDTPSDWGITDKGYYRHLFLGDIRVFNRGEFVGTARTYTEAQKIALDILKSDPTASITAKARTTFFGDPTTRISTRKFFKLVGDIAEETTLTQRDIMDDLRGKVGRQSMRSKWAGYTIQRKGAEGFSRAYEDVMRMHAAQVYRTQELSKLNRAVTPMIENLNRFGKPGLANEMKEHLDALWGTPNKFERDFGKLIRQSPVLRNNVGMPEMAFRGLARRLTGLQSLLKLRLSPRSAVVNLLQPFSTLWPYMTTKEFGTVYTDFLKPSTRKWLTERGVLTGGTKLETTGRLAHNPPSAKNPLNWFQNASEVNRGVGYLFGYKRGLARGLSEAQAHDLGLSWAEKVEFDNSVTNVQPIMRDPRARVLMQFKSFTGKNLENVREIFAPSEPTPTAERTGRIGKWTAAQLGVGGAKSLGLATQVIGGYKIVQFLSQQLQEYGMEKRDADKWAEAVYYGAPSLIGQDLSASVNILEAPYGNTWMERGANFVFGPTVTTALKAGEAASQGNWEKAAKSITPAMRPIDVLRQAAQGKAQSVSVGRNEQVRLTPFEATMRALGFMPVKASRIYDKKDAGIKTRRSPSIPGLPRIGP